MASVQNTNGEGVDRVFDEDLNSRNLFTYGMDAMTKMARSSVAVIGLNGVGAEAAKSLILANVGTVTLVDDAVVAFKDLSTHFYLSEQDIGRNRADACHRQLQELNPNVVVRTHNQAVTQALIAQHNAIVVCDGSLPSLLHWNTLCRTLKPAVAFVLAEARGVCFRLFSDFGPEPYVTTPLVLLLLCLGVQLKMLQVREPPRRHAILPSRCKNRTFSIRSRCCDREHGQFKFQ